MITEITELRGYEQVAVADDGWRWLAGAAWIVMDETGTVYCRGRMGACDVQPRESYSKERFLLLPDFSDPGTVGCLEALVQERHGHDGDGVIVEARWSVGTGYRVVRWTRQESGGYQPVTLGGQDHPHKVAALVAALQVAPCGA